MSLDDDTLVQIALKLPLRKRGWMGCVTKQLRRVVRRSIGEELGLVAEQVDAFTAAMNGENVFITGGAGVGKSHLLSKIMAHLPIHGLAVTASTGCAAAIIGAVTFHSTLALGLGKPPAPVIVRRIMDNKWAKARLYSLETLVVDEVAMLTGGLFDKAGAVVGNVRRNYGHTHGSLISNSHPTVPWDTVQLILCGDFLQLPPVDVATNGWLFDAKCWNRLDLKTHILKHVHRQQDRNFVEILQRMRFGRCTPADHAYLVGHSAQVEPEGALKLFATNAPSDACNHETLVGLEGRFHVFNAIDSGYVSSTPNEQIEQSLRHCPAPKQLLLKVNARVMCLRNVHTRLVNGSLGTVSTVYPVMNDNGDIKHVDVVVTFDGQLGEESFAHTFSTHAMDTPTRIENVFTVSGQANRTVATRIQIPLRLAWACSVHKSQGMSLSRVSIDFHRTFADGQAYVALSRAKTLESVYIRGLQLQHMQMADPKALAFYERLEQENLVS